MKIVQILTKSTACK